MSEYQPDTDAWLIAAFRKEDPGYKAVENLLERIRRWVCRYHTPYRNEAKDIAHETVLRVSELIDDYDGTAKFFSWVCRIAHYVVLEYHRRLQREHMISLEALAAEETLRLLIDDTEDALILRMALEAAKALLTDAENEAIELRTEDLSFKEVGDRMGGISENAARKRAYSGAAKMRDYLVEKGWIVLSEKQVNQSRGYLIGKGAEK